jgi:hypothetical protein
LAQNANDDVSVSVSVSDVQHAADDVTNASAAAQDTVCPSQGTAVATAERSTAISAAASLQLQLRFKDHDMPIFSDSKLRWTTNGPSMYCHIRDKRVALCTALEAGIRIPGAEADKAMQVFMSAVESWFTPRGHSLTSILMEGLRFERESAAATDVDRFVIVSVIRWDDLQELANEIKANGNTTGLYAKE